MDLQDQFAGMVHGVKNQLQLLGPSVETLCANQSSEVSQAGISIGNVLDEINHQLVLMLSLYRLEDAKIFSTQEVHLIDILETACSRMKDVRIEVNCTDELVVFCDERLVTAVVGDALHNAIRYCQNRILVTGQLKDDGVVICIEDDGDGLEKGQETDLDSTGLGIELARRVAQAHRRGNQLGDVSLGCSEALGGARFSLYLP
tara:strand:+ start:43965 stop:44573 length:609 start_codon:yes stop_codon:yes gene_type:complete